MSQKLSIEQDFQWREQCKLKQNGKHDWVSVCVCLNVHVCKHKGKDTVTWAVKDFLWVHRKSWNEMKRAEWSCSLCKLSSRKYWDWKGIFIRCLLVTKLPVRKKERDIIFLIHCLPLQLWWNQSLLLQPPQIPLTCSSHVFWCDNYNSYNSLIPNNKSNSTSNKKCIGKSWGLLRSKGLKVWGGQESRPSD